MSTISPLFPSAHRFPAFIPTWWPAGLRSVFREAELRHTPSALDKVARKRMVSGEKVGVAEWAAEHRVVTEGAHVGPWNIDYAPHTKKIMDAFSDAWVREVWFCGVEQSGKTNTMLNCMGWAIDCAPGSIFYLMPTEDTSAKVVGGKIIPMLRQSKRLQKYLTSRNDDLTLSKITLNNGTFILPAHANSQSSTATWAARYAFGDEVDKYPAMSGKEADPITLIKKRNRTFKGRYKRFFSSTPAGMFIQAGMNKCQQVWEMHVCCPHCLEQIRMDVDHLSLPEGATADTISADDVGYACNQCGAIWDDHERERAIRGGRWHCRKGADVLRPATVGFHHRAWECLDISLHEIAVAWLKGKEGGVNEKTAWANGYEAIDYVHEQRDRSESHILRLVDPSMPRGICPRDPSAIIVLADTQQRGFYYQVWAYGWGRDLETWRIDHGYVEQFSHLADIGAKIWQDADGKEYRAKCGFIDSGGGTDPHRPKHSRTTQVYEFCRMNPFFRPLKGYRELAAESWKVSRLDYYPTIAGKKIPLPGGLTLYKINVTTYKNDLSSKIAIEPTDPGAYHLHAEMGEDYARQMCAEYQDERGWWICPNGRANHHWDLGVYGMAAADIVRIRDERKPGKSRPNRKIYSKGVSNG